MGLTGAIEGEVILFGERAKGKKSHGSKRSAGKSCKSDLVRRGGPGEFRQVFESRQFARDNRTPGERSAERGEKEQRGRSVLEKKREGRILRAV